MSNPESPFNISSERQSHVASIVGHVGDLQSMNLSYPLDGKKYLQWSQVTQSDLKGIIRKLSHLNGIRPREGDPKFPAWDEEDSMTMLVLEFYDTRD